MDLLFLPIGYSDPLMFECPTPPWQIFEGGVTALSPGDVLMQLIVGSGLGLEKVSDELWDDVVLLLAVPMPPS